MTGKMCVPIAVFWCLIYLQHISGIRSQVTGRRPCEGIPNIDFADTVSYSHGADDQGLYPHGSTVTIDCGWFYATMPSDSSTRTCFNGTWTGQQPRCRHIPRRCPKNDDLIAYYGKACQTQCPRRARCSGNKKCYCDGVCGWSCIAMDQDGYCPEITPASGVTFQYSSQRRRFQDRATFSCASGYRFITGATLKICVSDGTWEGVDIVCVPDQTCPPMPPVDNASPWQTSKLFFLPGESHSYSCNTGYGIYGDRSITCLANYTWSHPQFTCAPKTCGHPGDVPNAVLESNIFTFSSQVYYICVAGYELTRHSPRFRTCLATQRWSSRIPSCQRVSCPEIHSIEHGSVTGSQYMFRSRLTFQCNEGFGLEGSRERICQADRTWSGQETVCREIICEQPQIPVNGEIRLGGGQATYHHNDVIYYACNRGYSLMGSVSSYCRENGQWSYSVPTCGLPCARPPPIRNGILQISQSELTSDGRVVHGGTAEVECYNRYRRIRRLTCDNENWSETDSDRNPLCRGLPCPIDSLWSTPHLNIALDPRTAGYPAQITDGTRITYTCQRGHRISGTGQLSTSATCSNGRLTPRSTVSCQPVSCPRVHINHGYTVFRNAEDGQRVTLHRTEEAEHGMEQRLVCHPGYRRSSPIWYLCDDGQWNNMADDTLRCEPKPCAAINKSLSSIESISYDTNVVDGAYPNGTMATVQCQPHSTFALGNGSFYCQAQEWTPTLPVCLHSPNRAIGSKPRQRSAGYGIRGMARKAVDGRTSGYDRDFSCTRTGRIHDPWWKTTLPNNYLVTSVKIYNRLSGTRSQNNLTGAEITVGTRNDFNNPPCGHPISRQQDEASSGGNHGILITCEGLNGDGQMGKYVRVRIPTKQGNPRRLNLCEVEVFGNAVDGEEDEDTGEQLQSRCYTPDVPNANPYDGNSWIGQLLSANQSLIYRCHDGFTTDVNHLDTIPMPLTITCKGGNTWYPESPGCFGKSCPRSALHLDHSHLLQNDSVLFLHDTAVDFYCDEGYEKESIYPIFCQQGKLNNTVLKCNPIRCGLRTLLIPQNMIPTLDHYAHGESLTVTCEHGYEIRSYNGTDSLPVCDHGNWTGDILIRCQRVTCPDPGRANFATISVIPVPGTEGYVHGTEIRYECQGNRLLDGDESRHCNGGEWTGQVPQCIVPATLGPQPCMLPAKENNEWYSIQGSGALYIYRSGAPDGTYIDVSVQCDEGYTAQAAVHAVCQNGVWSEPIPTCVAMERTCEKPAAGYRVFQYIEGDEGRDLLNYRHDSLPEGTRLAARCSDPGRYSLRGSAWRTCSGGAWTGDEPACEPTSVIIHSSSNHPVDIRSDATMVFYTKESTRVTIQCTVPDDGQSSAEIENGGSLNFKDYPRKWAFFANVRHVKKEFFNPPLPSDSGIFTCRTYDGRITHSIRLEFSRIDCSPPGQPLHGYWNDYDDGWVYRAYPMTKVIHYACEENYELISSPRFYTCILGQWSEPTPTCQLSVCPELMPPTNGHMIGGLQRSVGGSAFFLCNHGFERIGQQYTECQSSLTWSQPVPECREIVEPPNPCDLQACEEWEKCVITGSRADCRCINPFNCPQSSGPEACGTDGQNYTSLCRLKATACLLQTGVEQAPSGELCRHGIIQPQEPATSAPAPLPSNVGDESASWSIQLDPEGAQESAVAPRVDATSAPPLGGTTMGPGVVPTEGEDDSTSPLDMCAPETCHRMTVEEACLAPASAAVVLYLSGNLSTDPQEVWINTVIFSEDNQAWRNESWARIRTDTSLAESRDCTCPPPSTNVYLIVIFSQMKSSDGVAMLLDTDYVQSFSYVRLAEVRRICSKDGTRTTPAPSATSTARQETTQSHEAPQNEESSSLSSGPASNFEFSSSSSDQQEPEQTATSPPSNLTSEPVYNEDSLDSFSVD